MSRSLLVVLSTVLWGCPAPLVSTLSREKVPESAPQRLRERTLASASCEPPDSAVLPLQVSCTPEAMNRLVEHPGIDRVELGLYGGRVVSSEQLVVRGDSAVLDADVVPMRRVDTLWLVQVPSTGERVRRAGVAAGSTALAGGLLGALSALRDGSVEPIADGALIGAGVGLATGIALARSEASLRVEVDGWSLPLALNNVLDASSDGCASPLPAAMTGLDRYNANCVTEAELNERAGDEWVRDVEVHLRDGGWLRGSSLVVSSGQAILDGQSVPLSRIARFELRQPRGVLRRVRRVVGSAFVGAAYASLVGGATALAEGNADPLWVWTAIGGGIGAAGGLTIELATPRDDARDVTFVPDPAGDSER